MILLTHESSIFLSIKPADFRCGIDGLVALCTHSLAVEPDNGCIYLFINRARTMIRALQYDGTGYWLMTKRLSKGRFVGWPSGSEAMSPRSARQLRILLSGDAGWETESKKTQSTLASQSKAVIIKPHAHITSPSPV